MRCLSLVAMLLISLIASAEQNAVPEPVEILGGNPVYGIAMPREGLVVSVAQVMGNPESFAGKQGKFSGRITEVCQKKGCWVVLADEDHYVRVTFKDYGYFVPKDSSGAALVFGLLQETDVDQAMADHLAGEGDNRASRVGGKEYRINAESILIKAD